MGRAPAAAAERASHTATVVPAHEEAMPRTLPTTPPARPLPAPSARSRTSGTPQPRPDLPDRSERARPSRRCPHGRTPRRLLHTTIAGYRPLELLRRRGCQNVFRAAAPDGTHVALKTTCHDADHDVLARAHNEAHGLRAAAAHPHVADLAGEGVHRGLHYLAVTWQQGPTLHHLLEHLDHSMAAWSPGSADVFTRLTLALCHALEGLHHHEVVHADLSPRNIVVGHGHTLTLIDLDSCAWHGTPTPDTLHRCATTVYAAPECLAPWPRPVPTAASDQYSAAAILYRVVQQRHHLPDTGSRTRTRTHQLTRSPRPLTGWPATTWPHLQQTLHRALDPDPDARHPTTGDFTSHLRHALTLTGERP
ncbi:protein kinase [Kitasatospora sp. NPDC096140]|uniref:protein kinase domain-containing protein n=1 Tax=Kitasatospora sp. NPDC096140 TaxID=3155425 RepID=UPI003327D9E8